MFTLRRLIVTVVTNMLALLAAIWLVGEIHVASTGTALIAGAVFGLVNVTIRPVVRLIALPLTIITLGLALFFINLMMIWLTSVFVGGFEVAGFNGLVKATLIVWVVNVVVHMVVRPPKKEHREDATRMA